MLQSPLLGLTEIEAMIGESGALPHASLRLWYVVQTHGVAVIGKGGAEMLMHFLDSHQMSRCLYHPKVQWGLPTCLLQTPDTGGFSLDGLGLDFAS